MKCALILGTLLLASAPAWGHGGGLNQEGCHNDRKNGGYHCHRGSGSAAPVRAPYVPPPNAPTPYVPTDPSGDRSFANCDEARAAGAAPLRRGERGYGTHLDRDDDGIACEPYRGK
jgi:hypothetical protein